MKSITTLLWAFAFLLTASSAEVKAQDIFATADSMFAAAAYNAASLECERVVFQHPGNGPVIAEALLRKTECLKKEKKFEKIPALLYRTEGFSLSDSLRQEIYLQQAIGYYFTDRFEQAEKRILPVFNLDTYNQNTRMIAGMLYALCLNEQARWSQAHMFLKDEIRKNPSLADNEKALLTASLDSLYNPDAFPKMKSIRKAKTLSLLFPGAGQAYNGDYGRGLLNLLLVSGSAGFGVYNVLATNYVTAATAGVYLFLYFYLGGANQSNWTVPVKNYKKKNAYNEKLKAYIHFLPEHYINAANTHDKN